MSREWLLEIRLQKFERLPKNQEIALEKLEAVRLHNKGNFDKTHHFRFKPIKIGDWVLGVGI